jgi:hypothetical protein
VSEFEDWGASAELHDRDDEAPAVERARNKPGSSRIPLPKGASGSTRRSSRLPT